MINLTSFAHALPGRLRWRLPVLPTSLIDPVHKPETEPVCGRTTSMKHTIVALIAALWASRKRLFPRQRIASMTELDDRLLRDLGFMRIGRGAGPGESLLHRPID